MAPAVFLDRDGVLTYESFAIIQPSKMEIFDYSKECVDRIHECGFYAIVITNQSGVARGLFSEEDLIKANNRLMEETGVDDVFYCPHHPEGIVTKYKMICGCRKPGTKMVEAARKRYNIDIAASYMVGDRATDVLMGQAVGLRTVLVDSGYGREHLEQDVKPDYYCRDLRDFVMRRIR